MLPPGAGTAENTLHLANSLVLSHNHEQQRGWAQQLLSGLQLVEMGVEMDEGDGSRNG